MKFPAHFLGGIPELDAYRKPMEFLPDALADQVESYAADFSPEPGAKHIPALTGLDLRGLKICDFFAPLETENRMLVVEETQLVLQMKEQGDIDEKFAAECRDKMSGSAKILGALYAEFVVAKGGEENPRQADCEFWVVVADIDNHNDEGDVRAYDALREFVLDFLRGELFRPYDRVEITGVNGFGAELENRIPAAGETTL